VHTWLFSDKEKLSGTQENDKRVKKKIIILILLVILAAGCATIPTGENLPVYSIGGVAYYPLSSICDSRDIRLQYDALTKVALLEKDSHQIILRPGDSFVLVDKRVVHLNYPVEIYQGVPAVPWQFKEEIIDVLFKPFFAGHKHGTAPIKLAKVVIDAGHGGNDPGAIGKSGLREKDVNLDIARRLSDLLRAEGVETVLTRSSDRFIPLGTRVNIANKSGAELFISIHSNASRSRSLNGFEVYYVSPSVSDSKRAYYASRRGRPDLINAEFASNSQELKAIIWDLIYANSRAESIELSHSICNVAGRDLNARILGVKGARFEVLRGIQMPGVLVEVGFVSNRGEEKLLRSSVYRQRLAEGILEGIREYSQGMALVEMAEK